MHVFDFREPVSAGSHLAWFVLACPGALLLWRRAAGARDKQISLLIYTLSLALCSGSSALFHALRLPAAQLARFNRLDHIGIFFLIAGSYTPVVWNIMTGRRKWLVLTLAWLTAAAGAGRIAVFGLMSPPVATGLYLAMGWGAIFCYVEIARTITHRSAWPLMCGGTLYSVGALFHVFRWPVLWTGVFAGHELFHLFVLAGSTTHYWFMLTVVAPFASGPERGGFTPKPHLAFARRRRDQVRKGPPTP